MSYASLHAHLNAVAQAVAPKLTEKQWGLVRYCAVHDMPVIVVLQYAGMGPAFYNGPPSILFKYAPWPEDLIEALGFKNRGIHV